MHFIIAYDVTNPARLQKLHRTLTEFALPIQKSVFLLTGTETLMAKCRAAAEKIVNSKEDDLRFYTLPERGLKLAYGRGALPDGIYLSGLPDSWDRSS